MAYQVVCPNCSAKLKSAQPVAVGRTLTCPQCKHKFTLTEPAAQVDTQPLAAGPAAGAASSRDVVTPRRGSKAEINDIESADIVDAADFDFSPRSKGRGRRGEDDDRRSRGERDDPEDDRRPRRRDRNDVDEESIDRDDDRPRSRPRKTNKGLLIGLFFGLGAFVFLLFIGLLLLIDPFHFFASSASEMIAWVPSEMQAVEGADVEALTKNTKVMGMTRGDVKDAENIGVKLEDMSSYLVAKRSPKGSNELMVVKLKNPADKDKIIKSAGGQEATASGKKYYRTKDKGALYFASDKLLILAKSENTLTPLLAKDPGQIVVSDEMKSAVQRADGDFWNVAVGPDSDVLGSIAKGPGLTGPPPAKSSVMTGTLAGSDLNLKFETTYADSDSAKKAQTAIETVINLIKLRDLGSMKKGSADARKAETFKKMFESAKFSVSGAVLTVTMTASVDAFEDLGKSGGARP